MIRFGKKALPAAIALSLAMGSGTALAAENLYGYDPSKLGTTLPAVTGVTNNSTTTDVNTETAIKGTGKALADVVATTGVDYTIASGEWGFVYGVCTAENNVTLTGNKLTITGGTIENNLVVAAPGDMSGNNKLVNAINNELIITGGTFTGSVTVGSAGYNSSEGQFCGNASGNKLYIDGSGVKLGDLVRAGDAKYGTAKDNYVKIANCAESIGAVGGKAEGGGSFKESYANTNTVEITGGNFVVDDKKDKDAIVGGDAKSGVEGNKVIISGGTFAVRKIAGGETSEGNAIGNIVTITGGTFTNEETIVYGGFVSEDSKLEEGETVGSAKDNTINLGGYLDSATKKAVSVAGVDLSKVKTVYGGISYQGSGCSGNSLNVFSVGNKVGGLEASSFQNLNFYIPSDQMDATGSKVMLEVDHGTVTTFTAGKKSGEVTITPTSTVDLSNAKISAGVVDVGSYSKGSKITLISVTGAGGTLKTSGTYGTLTDGVMNVPLSYAVQDGNKLVATADEGGGGGGGGGGTTTTENAKSPVETQAAGISLLNTGADMMAGATLDSMQEAIDADTGSAGGSFGGSALGGVGGADGKNGSALGGAGGADGKNGSALDGAGSADGKNGSVLGKDGRADGKNGSALGKDGKADGKNGSALGRVDGKSEKDDNKDKDKEKKSGGVDQSIHEAGSMRSMMTPFGVIGGSSMRVKTGSYVDMKSWNINVGFAKEIRGKNGKFVFGPVFEYGKGNYDSYLDNGTHGDGSSSFWGVGFVGKQKNNGGEYWEGSIRVGRISNDYSAIIAEKDMSYDNSATYYAVHVGVGKEFKVSKRNSFDCYLKLFYSHQNSSEANLKCGYRYAFDSIDSWRTRLGFRYNHLVDKCNTLYAGLAWQHEFGSRCNATVYSGDYMAGAPAPSAKGDTGILELGCKLRPNRDDRFEINIGVAGYAGKQRGLGGTAQFLWRF